MYFVYLFFVHTSDLISSYKRLKEVNKFENDTLLLRERERESEIITYF